MTIQYIDTPQAIELATQLCWGCRNPEDGEE